MLTFKKIYEASVRHNPNKYPLTEGDVMGALKKEYSIDFKDSAIIAREWTGSVNAKIELDSKVNEIKNGIKKLLS